MTAKRFKFSDGSEIDLERTSSLMRAFLAENGMDIAREGLNETPMRYAKAFEFWTSGYMMKPEDVIKMFEDGGENYDEMVVAAGIPFYSHCEHHIAPFFGVAHVAYIPGNGKVVGLSKMSRLVDIFARRLQTQERLTQQIASAMDEHLKPLGCGVVLRARHMCIESRGVQKTGSITYTSALKGAIKDKPEARAEFLSFVHRADEQCGRI